MSTRPNPIPPEANTIHLLGDVQTALPLTYATSMRPDRRSKLADDFRTGRLPTPAGGHWTVGDLIHRGQPTEDADAKALFADLTANTGKPVWPVIGNHDIYDNVRSPEQFAADWGMPSPSYTVDLGFVQMIVVGLGPQRNLEDGTPDRGGCFLENATITWLDQQLQAAGKDCWVICHAPLKDTITGTDRLDAISYVQPPAPIIQVVADNPNVKAWISGHTHTPTDHPDAIVTTSIGGRPVAHINAAGLVNTALPGESIDWAVDWLDRMDTLWVTYVDEQRYEIRYRNHGSRTWGAAPTLPKVTVVDF